jgi:hypothetical protein
MDWDRARRRGGLVAPLPVPPTDRQLAYIARLAEGLGVSIVRPPATRSEASVVIDGLKRRAGSAGRRRRAGG